MRHRGGGVQLPRVIYTVAMLVARRLVLRGRVQGVGFRFFAEDLAQREGVHGWVTNRADGAIELFIEGDREAVDRLEGRLRHGPPGARVDAVTADDDVPTGRATGFRVRM
jgi:acylphosphatase